MEAIASWLKRAEALTAKSSVQATVFRAILFGNKSLDVDDWLITFEPHGPIQSTPHSLGTESLSLLRLLDEARQEINLHERHRLGADLAAAISLALDRRVVIPNDLAISVPGSQQILFQPVAHIVDPSILGPVPIDAKERISTVFSAIHGLPQKDLITIGAATSAHHSALLLFDKEPRVAYTLLVAGIETLSRRYGSPPTAWEDWNDSGTWSQLLDSLGLESGQISSIREKLMKDRQLRLGATFQQYAATRPPEAFWRRSVDAWIPGIDGNTGQWLSSVKSSTHRVSDFVPIDKSQLRKALAKSYALRSSVVHEAEWVEMLAMAGPIGSAPTGNKPLSFPALRLLLGELIRLELSSQSSSAELPDVRLSRKQPPGAA